MEKVFGSIGHGGSDPGAVEGKFIEKNMNLIYGKACMDELSKYLETKISRTGDTFIGLSGLVAMSNNYMAKIHLAFHLNAGKGDGCEIYHSMNSKEGKKLAEAIAKRIAAMGQNAHGQYVKTRPGTININKDYYTELDSTRAIAVIIEPAFIDSADVEFVDTDVELKRLGIEVAHGVLDYLGISIKPVVVVPAVKEIKVKYCLEFQVWYNKTTQTTSPLVEDGVWGPATDKAYKLLDKLIKGEY
jgi:N-acetylmuramoyl-L-alanine amidase